MASLFWSAVLVLSSCVLYRLFLFWQFSNFGIRVYTHYPGPCELIPGVEQGAEDMEMVSNGIVFMSSGIMVGDPSQEHWSKQRGKILKYDINNAGGAALEMKLENFEGKSLNPHGISSFTTEKGVVTLFVVNHDLPNPDTIELFAFDPKKPDVLTWIEGIQSDTLRFVNDVVATDPRSFYFTNFKHYRGGILQTIEMFGKFYWGAIGHCTGKDCTILDTGFFVPNGINLSPNKRALYVSHIGDGEVVVYQRDPKNSKNIKKVQEYPVYTIVDNINVDANTGDLWVGSIPNVTIPATHGGDPTQSIPVASQVLRLHTDTRGLITGTKQVYADDGYSSRWLMSTVAVHKDGNLLIGSLLSKALHCKILYKD